MKLNQNNKFLYIELKHRIFWLVSIVVLAWQRRKTNWLWCVIAWCVDTSMCWCVWIVKFGLTNGCVDVADMWTMFFHVKRTAALAVCWRRHILRVECYKAAYAYADAQRWFNEVSRGACVGSGNRNARMYAMTVYMFSRFQYSFELLTAEKSTNRRIQSKCFSA